MTAAIEIYRDPQATVLTSAGYDIAGGADPDLTQEAGLLSLVDYLKETQVSLSDGVDGSAVVGTLHCMVRPDDNSPAMHVHLVVDTPVEMDPDLARRYIARVMARLVSGDDKYAEMIGASKKYYYPDGTEQPPIVRKQYIKAWKPEHKKLAARVESSAMKATKAKDAGTPNVTPPVDASALPDATPDQLASFDAVN